MSCRSPQTRRAVRPVARAARLFVDQFEARQLLAFVQPAQFVNYFPSDAKVIDVTTQGILPNSTTPQTAAIQALFTKYSSPTFEGVPAKKADWILYFPAGTYVVDDQITANGTKLVGHSTATTKFKLVNNAANFQSTTTDRAVLNLGIDSNHSYRQFVSDITIEVGSGNPGAVGMRYLAHNRASVYRVNIVSPSRVGKTGLLIGRFSQNSGNYAGLGQLTRDIKVDGFDYGIRVSASDGMTVFDNIEVKNQNLYGFHSVNQVAVNDFTSIQTGNVPAYYLQTPLGTGVTLTNASLTTTGTVTTPAVIMTTNTPATVKTAYLLEDITQSGYPSILSVNGTVVATGSSISEIQQTLRDTGTNYSPHTTAHPNNTTSLDLPDLETPLYMNNTASDYQPMGRTTATMQAAMNSGKKVIYAPSDTTDVNSDTLNQFKILDTITIPSSVELVDFYHQSLHIADWSSTNTNPTIRITGTASDPPLTIRRMNVASYNGTGLVPMTIEHVGGRTVILEDSVITNYVGLANAGDVFLADVVLVTASFSASQDVTAAWFDIEQGPVNTPFITLDGARLRILGIKSERIRPMYRLLNGAQLDVYTHFSAAPSGTDDGNGRWFLDLTGTAANPSRASVAGTYHYGSGGLTWPDLIRDVRDGVTQTNEPGNQPAGTAGRKYGLVVVNPTGSVTIPSAPSSLGATAASSTQINLTWTDNSTNETGFEIDRATNSTFSAGLTTFTVGSNVTSYSSTGLSASTTYYYRVRSTNAAGDSANTATVNATTHATTTVPSAPSGLSATAASSSQINLSWTDNSNNETGFEIDRATNSSFSAGLTSFTVGANVTTYASTGLSASTTYYYRVRSTNAAGDSANTATASATTHASSAARTATNVIQFESVGSVSGDVNSGAAVTAGSHISGLAPNEYVKYASVNFGAGTTQFRGKIASPISGTAQTIEIRVDSTTGPLLATWSVQGTGSWSTILDRTITVTGTTITGVRDLFFVVPSTGTTNGLALYDFNFVAAPSLVAPLAGDANNDGIVNFGDLLVLAQNYGRSSSLWEHGDFDGDGLVGFSDLLALAQNYQQQTASLSSSPFSSRSRIAQTRLGSR
jgi:Carbohydrate binding module (family 6)/Fibronectin type III domain